MPDDHTTNDKLSKAGSKLRGIITTFTDQQKDLFNTRLTDQLAKLMPQLDDEGQAKLKSLSVAQVVDHISDIVVDNVVKQGLSILTPAAAPPLYLLSREVATQLAGLPTTQEQYAAQLNNQLNNLAAATYVSEIAQSLFYLLVTKDKQETGVDNSQPPNPPVGTLVDDELKTLISKTAMTSSPMGAPYRSDGGINRAAVVTFKDAGNIIMSAAPFFGPDAPLVFVIGVLVTML
ncbi:hypothetical protein QFC22_006492 [Naganishia vaughanmartiniae]|uniref:Uncharacterized protein n=1 Tax=Naganishia vaughanmartiniae TaxID=1424756 RepID=A0ACC2WK71_9TREE|nr:hypothetical protein QFC22_006492 [Naganishia vaughanmartiniae]